MPNNQCETFEFIYKLWTSNVHWLNFTPYLRVMNGSGQFKVRTNLKSFEVIPNTSTTSSHLNELCTIGPREQKFVFACFALKAPACTAFYFFQKLCIKGQHFCNFVPYFKILQHNPRCAYVHIFCEGCAPYAPSAQLCTSCISCTCQTTNAKLLN